jgi:hypothetical protein
MDRRADARVPRCTNRCAIVWHGAACYGSITARTVLVAELSRSPSARLVDAQQ